MFSPFTQPIYYDIMPADYFIVFGNGIKKVYENEAKKYFTEIIPVGSIPLDKIKGNIRRKSKINIANDKIIVMPLRG